MADRSDSFLVNRDLPWIDFLGWSGTLIGWLQLESSQPPQGYLDSMRRLGRLVLNESEHHSHSNDDPQLVEELKSVVAECSIVPEAYMMLAELEPEPSKVESLVLEARRAGQWMIDRDETPEDAGQEQIVEESLQYYFFRTLFGMSDLLWGTGQRVTAVELLGEACKLDQTHDLRAIFVLATRYLELGWLDESIELFNESWQIYLPEASPTDLKNKLPASSNVMANFDQLLLRFLRLLVNYAKDGPSEELSDEYRDVDALAPRLTEYIVGYCDPSEFLAAAESNRGEPGVAMLALTALPCVRSLSGFIRWARSCATTKKTDKVESYASSGESLERLKKLPSTDETWYAIVRNMGEGHLVAIYVEDSDDVVYVEPTESKPTSASLWSMVVEGMSVPNFGHPRRPARICVRLVSLMKSWNRRTSDLGIEVQQFKELPQTGVINALCDTIQQVEQRIELDEGTLDRLSELPESMNEWVVAVYRPPLWATVEGQPSRAQVVLVGESSSGYILMHDLLIDVDDKSVGHALAKAMLMPLGDEIEPQKPRLIRIQNEVPARDLFGLCERIGVECFFSEDIDVLDEYMEEMIRHSSGEMDATALTDDPEVSIDEIRLLYESAARFYKAAIWKSVPADRAVELQCENVRQEPWLAVPIGQMGVNLGVVIYDDIAYYEESLNSNLEQSPPGVYLNYVEAHDMVPIDLWFAEQNNFRIVNEEAYPLIGRASSDEEYRVPKLDELKMMYAALRVLPGFVSQPVADTALTVDTTIFGESAQVRLRWV